MAKRTLDSRYGKVRALHNNPRQITSVAFQNLVESIRRDSKFMALRPIVVDADNEIIGGNQRFQALIQLGYDRIPDEWIRRAEDLTPEERERFIIIDNSPDGIAGTFDYDILASEFSPSVMRDAGIDMSRIGDAVSTMELEAQVQEEVEHSDVGEDSEKIKKFKEARQKANERYEDMVDSCFYSVLIFQSYEQRVAFMKALEGVCQKYDGLFLNGCDLAKRLDISLPTTGAKPVRRRVADKLLKTLTLGNGGE